MKTPPTPTPKNYDDFWDDYLYDNFEEAKVGDYIATLRVGGAYSVWILDRIYRKGEGIEKKMINATMIYESEKYFAKSIHKFNVQDPQKERINFYLIGSDIAMQYLI